MSDNALKHKVYCYHNYHVSLNNTSKLYICKHDGQQYDRANEGTWRDLGEVVRWKEKAGVELDVGLSTGDDCNEHVVCSTVDHST